MEKKNGPVRALQIVYLALLTGQLLFAVIAFVLVKSGFFGGTIASAVEKILQTIYVIATIAAIWIAFYLFKKKLEQAEHLLTLKEKFNVYRSACITKYALLEGANLLSVVFFLITANSIFLIFAVVLMFVFMTLNPIRQRIKFDLQLEDADIDKLNDLQG